MFVISGRFFDWQMASTTQQRSFGYNQWQSVPLNIQDQQFIQKIEDDKNDFRLLKSSIFALGPVTYFWIKLSGEVPKSDAAFKAGI